MAGVTWTEEQKKVIETRGRNLLVSAAAGSGKTAVLVERIIRMVTDPEHPVDIDRLLVMTFTNAAASEMRERIGDALEKKLEENPGDANLERQATLIHHARITTIDSFCLGILREHFNELDIDPGFRIGDEGELLLLQADVMKDLLEEYYARGDDRFIKFVDTYASGKTDSGLEDYILQVWQFSQSNPWPGEWIRACKDELNSEDAADPSSFDHTEWMQFLLRDVRRQAADFVLQLEQAINISMEIGGPEVYVPTLEEDLEAMYPLTRVDSYEKLCNALSAPMFGRITAARGEDISAEKKERASALRKSVKDAVKKMKALYMPGDREQIYEDMTATREPVLMLLELAVEFSARFQQAKEEKNLVDFNDLEHMALEILTGGSADHSPGPVADELSGLYEEILVDEYQDSNQVQETLIQCISRERFGKPNVFMVGDVKQSIYRFRLAKPELFLEKYETYEKEDGPYQKIELHKNFRSRPEVLASVNDVFYQIMTRQLGNIDYTEDAALYPGAGYPETEIPDAAKTELLLLNTGDELFAAMDEEQADYSAKEAEARLVAAKIREMTNPETGMKIWNAKTGQSEPLKRGDIVILLRSLSGWAEEFLSVLSAEGIPAFAESRSGYFTAVEVETVLNMLALVDNPMQDIPLAGVLRSPIVGLLDRELAVVVSAFKKNAKKGQDAGLYGAVKDFLERSEEDEKDTVIFGKLTKFWELLLTLRGEAEYLPVHRLLYRVFELTGYYDYVSAMPAGRVRQANLNMLVEKASAFEKTSYQSLFDFIRYIEKLKKFDTDFGEASRNKDSQDTVRIMSIHKSKGLEFPVVFLCGAGKQFNRQDSRGKILIDETLGVATDFFDVERRLKAPTLKKNVLSRRMNLENMGEELRVLYVAMTRAKEKLIVTAGSRYLDSRLEKCGLAAETDNSSGKGRPFAALSSASSYMEWFLMAANYAKASLTVSQVPVLTLLQAETASQAEKAGLAMELAALRESQSGKEADPAVAEFFHYAYPHQEDVTLHAKLSVSELKERGQFVDDAASDFLPTIPEFMRKEEENGASGEMPDGAPRETGRPGASDEVSDDGMDREESAPDVSGEVSGEVSGRKESASGASDEVPDDGTGRGESAPGVSGEGSDVAPDTSPVSLASPAKSGLGGTFRGTAYHRALELISFTAADSYAGVKQELSRLQEEERMDPAALKLIRPGILWKFFQSDIASRMRRADRDGMLYKERQFVIGVPAREMDEADSDELVIIQGMIDAWFEEEDGLVLVDYKTDRIGEGEEHVLIDRYRLQMIYYARALSQITGKRVKETVIYSLSLQKEISVECSL